MASRCIVIFGFVQEQRKDCTISEIDYPSYGMYVINPDNKLITLANIEWIIWIHQIIKRTMNTMENNL